MSTSELQFRLAKLAFVGQTRIRFYEVLKMQLESGKTLRDALDIIRFVYSRGGKKKSHPFVLLAQDGMAALSSNQEGHQIQDVFARWFSGEEAAALAVGLRSHSLIKALDALIALIKALKTIRGRIVMAALAPFAAVMALAGLFALIAWQLVPPLQMLLPAEKATGALAIVYGIAAFTQTQGAFWLTAMLAGFVASIVSLRTWTGWGRSVADHLPPWSLYKLLQGCLFLMNLATLLGANMGFGEALLTLQKTGSPWLQVRLRAALRHFDNGDNLGVALGKAGHAFPSAEMIMHLQMLSDGTHAPEAIRRLALWWLTRAETIARAMQMIALLLSTVLVFTCLGIIAMSMLSLRSIVNM